MTEFLKIILLCTVAISLSSCSQVLQSVDLSINSEDNSLQEEFNVVEKTLTIKEAKKQNATSYSRAVLKNGRGGNAKPIPEKLALKSEFPQNNSIIEYKIGTGDVIEFSRLFENNRASVKKTYNWPTQKSGPIYQLGIGDRLALTILKKAPGEPKKLTTKSETQNIVINPQQSENTITSSGRIGSDGSVLLLEVGRLEANGKSLNELRSEIRNILIRNGVSPRFQLEIVEFNSQKSYLTINSRSSIVVLDDQKKTMRDILTSADVGIKPGVITHITLQRNNEEFSITLRNLYSESANNINVLLSDHIFRR